MKQTVIQYITGLRDGGAETLVKDYALLLDKENFDVKILITRPHEETANLRRIEAAGIPVFYIYPRWNVAVRLFNKIFGNIYRPYRVLRTIRKTGATVVHAHLEVLKNLAPISRKLKGVRLLFTCHSVPEYKFGKPGSPEYSAAMKLLAHNDLQMIALHDQMRCQMDEMFDTDTTKVIHNGVQLEQFANVEETVAQIRDAEGIPENAFVLGHVGRFSKVKNHAFLIKVFQHVLEKRKDAFLLLVGSGELREQIVQQIADAGLSDKVLMLSGRTDIPRLMKAMDVFVMPSHYEGLPVTLIEAQAAALRCVVSDVVNPEAFRTDRVVPMSLASGEEKWAEVVLDASIRGPHNPGLDEYDMKKEIKHLETLYRM